MNSHLHYSRHSYKAALIRVIEPFIFGARVRPILLSPYTNDRIPLELKGDFDDNQLGDGQTEYENSKHYLTYVVASRSTKYSVQHFIATFTEKKARRIFEH